MWDRAGQFESDGTRETLRKKDAASILIVIFISSPTIYITVQWTHDSGWLTIHKINTVITTINSNFHS